MVSRLHSGAFTWILHYSTSTGDNRLCSDTGLFSEHTILYILSFGFRGYGSFICAGLYTKAPGIPDNIVLS